MVIITRKYFFLSVALIVVGSMLISQLCFLIEPFVSPFRDSKLGQYLYFIGLGFPFAWLNELETKTIWRKILKENDDLALLGLSSGFLLGLYFCFSTT